MILELERLKYTRGSRFPETNLSYYNIAYRHVTSYSSTPHALIRDPSIVTTLLILEHRLRDHCIVERVIDRTEHDFDDKICAEGRLCLAEGGRIHHVLINNAINIIKVKICCGY